VNNAIKEAVELDRMIVTLKRFVPVEYHWMIMALAECDPKWPVEIVSHIKVPNP
jgi:hypothetical protein